MKGNQGFTLLEVVIAMAIFSITALGITRLQIGTLQANAYAKRRTIALNFAQDKVEKVRSGQACSAAQLTYGSLTFALVCTTANGPNNTQNVTVTVSWSDPTAQSVQIQTRI